MTAAHRSKATEWAGRLGMTPHPEGGWYKETYRSDGTIPQQSLDGDFDGPRNFSTGIYFLLTADVFSAFHRIRSDEMWHFYAGDGLVIHEIAPDGTYTSHRLGPDHSEGEVFQLVIPAGSWFASEVRAGGEYGLVGCTVAPGFDFRDFEMAKRDDLTSRFPQHSSVIGRLCRE